MPAEPMSAQDRLDVMDVIASYSRCLDTGDVDGWLENFMPDAVLESLNGTATGHEELRAWAMRLINSGVVANDPQQLVHFLGLPRLRGTSERCTAETYTLIIDYDEAKNIRVAMVGRYEDTCVPHGGRWRFERRIIHADLRGAHRRATARTR